MALHEELERLLRQTGAALVGFSDLRNVAASWKPRPHGNITICIMRGTRGWIRSSAQARNICKAEDFTQRHVR